MRRGLSPLLPYGARIGIIGRLVSSPAVTPEPPERDSPSHRQDEEDRGEEDDRQIFHRCRLFASDVPDEARSHFRRDECRDARAAAPIARNYSATVTCVCRSPAAAGLRLVSRRTSGRSSSRNTIENRIPSANRMSGRPQASIP